ncbi:glycosyl hydrolase [Streptomyces anthocyanicus]|nr:glycosyl hydrolase [Streptomyces anthocyanicus]
MTMQPWFNEAKLGIFVHYGIYSVDGVPESWAFFDQVVPHEQYMRQLDGFTAAAFDPSAWAGLFARAGAGYAVLTARHHDGVALWDTRLSDLSVVGRTPAGRDLVAEYVSAMRDRGLRAGLYYSHSDWNHPDYASVRHPRPPHPELVDSPYVSPAPGAEDPRAWERYLDYRDGQVRELLTRFGPDLLWFDGEWERSAEQWRMSELARLIRDLAPDTVCNSRLLGHGDYATPEQGLPISAPETDWELCLTVNDSWGYRPQDVNHKSVGQLVRYFAQTIGMGGNLLLNVGPRADGTITPEQAQRLEGLGDWIRRHSAAVHGTVGGLPPGHHYGPSTLPRPPYALPRLLRPAERNRLRPRPAQRRTPDQRPGHREGTRPPAHRRPARRPRRPLDRGARTGGPRPARHRPRPRTRRRTGAVHRSGT